MNPFCTECGFRLQRDSIEALYFCDACGHRVSELELLLDKRPAPMPKHGEKCCACHGAGTVEVEFTEWHPYGDTNVPEYLTCDEECPDCGGLGYFLDDCTCIACGEIVKDGCLVQGWEVHEDCMDEFLPSLPEKEVDSDAGS